MMDERGLLDLPFLVLVVLLVTIGVIMVFSSSYARAYYKEKVYLLMLWQAFQTFYLLIQVAQL